MKRKELSLGKTINIDNYESLRVDMTWELDKPEDHDRFSVTLKRAINDLQVAIEDVVRALK